MAAHHLFDILPVARELSEANKVLQDRESVLCQLGLLRRLSGLLKQQPKMATGLCNVIMSVFPGVDCENVVVSVQHAMKGYDLDPRYWSLQLFVGKHKVSTWNFSKFFIFGDCEKFSTQIYPEFSSANNFCEQIEVNLLFCMQWSDVTYTTSFPLCRKDIDVLHVLDPGRRSSTTLRSMSAGAVIKDWPSAKYPPVTKFCLYGTEKVIEMFIREIFLQDANITRNFNVTGSTSEILMNFGGNFCAYLGEDRISVSVRKEQRVYCLTVTCPSPEVLYLVKKAIHNRLVRLCESDVLRIKTGEKGFYVDQLNELMLKLQALCDGQRSIIADCNEDLSTLISFYHELREASTAVVEFRHVDDTKVVSKAPGGKVN